MGNIKNFKEEKIMRGVEAPITVAKDVYKENLYLYACGQSGTIGGRTYGWLQGAEYMLEQFGIDYRELRAEVKQRIEAEGREVVNGEYFEIDK